MRRIPLSRRSHITGFQTLPVSGLTEHESALERDLVIRAINEKVVRLNIRKPILREWRREFARHLCTLGVAAKATERTGRLPRRAITPKGIYRPGRVSPAPQLP